MCSRIIDQDLSFPTGREGLSMSFHCCRTCFQILFEETFSMLFNMSGCLSAENLCNLHVIIAILLIFVRIFLHRISMLWLSICSQEGIFYFWIPWKVFGDLLERSCNFMISLTLINDQSFLRNHYQHLLVSSQCLSTKISHPFTQFIRPRWS